MFKVRLNGRVFTLSDKEFFRLIGKGARDVKVIEVFTGSNGREEEKPSPVRAVLWRASGCP